MSRYTGPTTRINRRFGMPIFAESKAMQKKPYIPGQHGPRLRRRVTDYSMGLNEKQKLRFMFGLSEKQFRLTFERAKKVRGVTGEIFMQMLETRLARLCTHSQGCPPVCHTRARSGQRQKSRYRKLRMQARRRRRSARPHFLPPARPARSRRIAAPPDSRLDRKS